MIPEPAPHSKFHLFVRLPLSKALGWILLTILGPLFSRHRFRVPRRGGLLVLSNHQADVDPVAVQITCRRPLHFISKSELFEGFLGRLIRKYGAFPVRRGEPDRAAIKHAVELLKLGEALLVFPEGELSMSGDLLPLKTGIALMVRMSGAQVQCVGLRNTRRVMPYGTTIPRPAFRFVSATWGEPRTFDRKAETEEIMAWVDAELCRLAGIGHAPAQVDEPGD